MTIFEQIPINEEEGSENKLDLSPELVDLVMSKVDDVNAPGTAVTWIRSIMDIVSVGLTEQTEAMKRLNRQQRLKSILENGLLGIPREQIWPGAHESGEDRKLRWVENVKHRNFGGVYFNILGRSTSYGGLKTISKISDAQYYKEEGLGLTFDLKTAEETERDSFSDIPRKSRTFWSYKRPDVSDRYSEEYGFVMAGRIPPRALKGIVIDTEKADLQSIESIVKSFSDKPQSLLPIYDIYGNLLWPEQISYEDIVKKDQASIV